MKKSLVAVFFLAAVLFSFTANAVTPQLIGPPVSARECTDSDGGQNYYVAGVGNGKYAGSFIDSPVICGLNGAIGCFVRTDGVPYDTVYDHCQNANQLNEALCASDGTLNAFGYQCPGGCSNGACINTTTIPDSCTDSDGLNYYTKGTIRGYFNGRFYEYTDYCIDTPNYWNYNLAELSCNGTNTVTNSYMCPNGCSNGACVSTSTCGNGVCEAGEADFCPVCTTNPCPAMPCRLGTCPTDCETCLNEGAACGSTGVKCCSGLTCKLGLSVNDVSVDATGTCVRIAVCGNGVINSGEQCDDGNLVDGDGCSSTCTIEQPSACGNATVQIRFKQADNVGSGNLQKKVFVGSNGMQYGEDQPIPLSQNGLFIMDSGRVEDVPGISLQRLNGRVRFLLYGSIQPTDREILSAQITLRNAVVTGFSNDRSFALTSPYRNNKVERQGDGISIPGEPSQDEVWPGIGTSVAVWNSTVNAANDGFYLNISCVSTTCKAEGATCTTRTATDCCSGLTCVHGANQPLDYGTCTKASTCGNGVCEAGEATICPACTTNPCPMIACRLGTCPADCEDTNRSIKLSAVPESGTAPLTVNFKAELSYSTCGITWDFGDGSGAKEACPVISGTTSVAQAVTGKPTVGTTSSGGGGGVGPICPAVCVPMWTRVQVQCLVAPCNPVCEYTECGSGCGPDGVTTFKTREECDGTTQQIKYIMHVYERPGTYYARASDGNVFSNMVTITVKESGTINVKIPSSFSLSQGQTATADNGMTINLYNIVDCRQGYNCDIGITTAVPTVTATEAMPVTGKPTVAEQQPVATIEQQPTISTTRKYATVVVGTPGGCGPNADPRCLGPPATSGKYTMYEGDTVEISGVSLSLVSIADKTARFEIAYTSTENKYTLELKRGWNLFSVPVTSADKILRAFTSNENNCIFKSSLWALENGRYVKSTATAPLKGYWIRVADDCTVTIPYDYKVSLDENGAELSRGWNMVGSQFEEIKFTLATGTCTFVKGPYWYNPDANRYELAEVMTPGRGYVVSVQYDCSIGAGGPPPLPE